MKKKLYIFAITAVMVFSFAGCGKKGKNEAVDVKADVIEFVNEELAAIDEKRSSAVDVYNSYFSDKKVNLDIFLSDMERVAIPNMEEYMKDLNAIETGTDEVENLKELYSLGAQFQLDAMNKVVLAIKEENPDYLTEASEMIKQSESYFGEYEAQLQLLAVDNGININGTVSGTNASTEVE